MKTLSMVFNPNISIQKGNTPNKDFVIDVAV